MPKIAPNKDGSLMKFRKKQAKKKLNARITMKIESVENEWRIKSPVIVVLRFAFYDPSECVCIRLYQCTHDSYAQWPYTHTHTLASVGDAFLSLSSTRTKAVTSFGIFLQFHFTQRQKQPKINILYSILWTIYFYCLVTY